MITSPKNERVKAVIELNKKKKARDEAGLFTVEGIRMISELPAERTAAVFASESFVSEEGERAEGLLRDVPYETVSDSVFNTMSDTHSPQGILALVKQYEYTLNDILSAEGNAEILILEDIRDPGNLGTMIRAGEAAGITGVVMSRGTADIYNPKTVRSTMGSIFRVPFIYTADLHAFLRDIKGKGLKVYAADPEGTTVYDEADYTEDTGFLIGNEGNGLTQEALTLADERIRIPMAGKVESLNAAIAASILMFEAAGQRRGRH